MKNSCIYGSKRITRTGNTVGKTELLPLRAPERISDQAFNCSLEGWAMTVQVRYTEMTGGRHNS